MIQLTRSTKCGQLLDEGDMSWRRDVALHPERYRAVAGVVLAARSSQRGVRPLQSRGAIWRPNARQRAGNVRLIIDQAIRSGGGAKQRNDRNHCPVSTRSHQVSFCCHIATGHCGGVDGARRQDGGRRHALASGTGGEYLG